MKKRILPALLALCMVMSLLPVSVFAADSLTEKPTKCETCGCTDIEEVAKAPDEATKCYTVKTEKDGTTTWAAVVCAHDKAPTDKCTVELCDVKGCTSYEKLMEKPHTHKATCGCDPSKCTDCAEKCECGDDKSCGASCKNQECNVDGCKDKGKVHDVEQHTFACGCVSKTPHTKDGKYTECDGEVTGAASKKGTLCDKCAADKAHSTTPIACTHSKVADSCLADTHSDDCIEACTKLIDCPATGEHKDKCVAAAVAAGTQKKDTVTFTVAYECACEYGHVDGKCDKDVEAGADNGCREVKEITETVEYAYEPTMKDGKEDAEATKTAKEKAEGDAKKAATDELDKEYKDKWICDACKAYTTNIVCDPTNPECQFKDGKPDPDALHKATCLSLCTMKETCTAVNHQIQYVVMNTKTNEAAADVKYTREDAMKELEKLLETAEGKVTEAEKALADAKKELSEADDVDKGVAAGAKVTAAEALLKDAKDKLAAEQAKYLILEVHCKSTGLPDSSYVVSDNVDDDDNTNTGSDDNKTDEVKVPETATDFVDVKEGAWYIPELNAMLAKGIVKGNPVKDEDGKVTGYKFEANEEMNVNYQVVFLSRVLEKGHNTEGAGWADEAKAWAAEEGLLEGIEDGKIDRKDVVLVLWRAMGKDEAEQDLSAFEDAAGLEGDHLAAMQWAVSAGIVKGDGDTGTLKTDSVITRAEMIAMLARLDEAK